MLSKLFHKKITSERPQISANSKDWPQEWRTVYFKEYPRFDAISLPKNVPVLKNLKEVLEQRHSARTFNSQKEISLEELGAMLYYSVGIKGDPGSCQNKTQEEKNKTRRFYPSGGARYPLEVYIAIKRVTGATPGIYHYNVPFHSIEKLLGKESFDDFDKTLGYEWAKDAAIVFIITAVWDRNFMKYQDFGYNIILIETGHMAQNLLLVSESLGLRYCPLAGFKNQNMNALLDINHDNESSLYLIAVGK